VSKGERDSVKSTNTREQASTRPGEEGLGILHRGRILANPLDGNQARLCLEWLEPELCPDLNNDYSS
jgi:hypothetical protein